MTMRAHALSRYYGPLTKEAGATAEEVINKINTSRIEQLRRSERTTDILLEVVRRISKDDPAQYKKFEIAVQKELAKARKRVASIEGFK